MPELKGTETEKNLLKAFAGESQARNRYTFFASTARKEGFVQIADIFAETADQEKELPCRSNRNYCRKPEGRRRRGTRRVG